MKAPRIGAWRCTRGHAFFQRHARCPRCGGPVHASWLPARGRLVHTTTVRVSPFGHTYRIGIARTAGVSTLCVVEGQTRGTGHDAVRLTRDGARIVARAVRPRRVSADNPARPPSGEGSRKS